MPAPCPRHARATPCQKMPTARATPAPPSCFPWRGSLVHCCCGGARPAYTVHSLCSRTVPGIGCEILRYAVATLPPDPPVRGAPGDHGEHGRHREYMGNTPYAGSRRPSTVPRAIPRAAEKKVLFSAATGKK
eukprot:gene24855-biopygen4446